MDFNLAVVKADYQTTKFSSYMTVLYTVHAYYVHYRFSSLFHDDKLGHCLDKDDPQLTLTTLQLLYQLVRSPSIAELICLHNDVACLPLTCYQCLVDPTPNTNDKDIIFKIRLQVQCIHALECGYSGMSLRGHPEMRTSLLLNQDSSSYPG